LILRKITKLVLRLKCTKFDLCWSSAPAPRGSLPGPLALFKGPTYKGRAERGREGKVERKGMGREQQREVTGGERREGEAPLNILAYTAPAKSGTAESRTRALLSRDFEAVTIRPLQSDRQATLPSAVIPSIYTT